MSLRDYTRILRSRWYVVVAASIVGLLLAGLYVGTATKQYTAKSQLFVSTPTSTDSTTLLQGSSFASGQVKSYAAVVTSPDILSPIITALRLPYTEEKLADEVSASAPLNTVLINLTVTDPDPARAQAIVNAVAAALSKYISTLETPPGSPTSPVKATVTHSALAPGDKTSPKTTFDLVLGLGIGLVVGLALAVALETLDNRVGGHADVESIANAPVLGLIGEDKLAKTKPLILLDDAFSRRAESFRQLRTNVRYLGVDRLLRSFVVTGSVESEGKSLTAANLAVALAQSGERVVLIDADLRRPTVAKTFGVPGGVGLTNVLVGTAKLETALQVWRPDLPLAILPSGPTPPNPSELLGSQRLIDLVRELQLGCDIVIFDSPPLLPVTDATLLARATDGAVIVTRARSTRLTQLRAATNAVRSADAHVLGLVINRIPRRGGDYGSYAYAGYHASAGYAPIAQAPEDLVEPDPVGEEPLEPDPPAPAVEQAARQESVDLSDGASRWAADRPAQGPVADPAPEPVGVPSGNPWAGSAPAAEPPGGAASS